MWQILFLSVLIPSYATAQLQDERLILGLKSGLNVAYLGGEDTGYVPRIGYHFGAYFNKPIGTSLSLQGELLYSLQGAQLENLSEVKLNYGYLILPVSARLNFYQKFSLGLGVQPAYLVQAKSKNPINTIDIKDDVNSLDFSLLLGADVRLYNTWSFSSRFTFGVNPTSKNAPARNTRFPNRVFQFSLVKLIFIEEKDKEGTSKQ